MKIPVQKYIKDGKIYGTIAEAVENSKAGEVISPVIEVQDAEEPEDIKSKMKKEEK